MLAESARIEDDTAKEATGKQDAAELELTQKVMHEILADNDDLLDEIENRALTLSHNQRINHMMGLVLQPPYVRTLPSGEPESLFMEGSLKLLISNPYISPALDKYVDPNVTYPEFTRYLKHIQASHGIEGNSPGEQKNASTPRP